MPENFYQRVLELERQVEIQKEKCPEKILKQLTNLYSDAIEYFGFLDDHKQCLELQMRMQGILVRPYVLDCLAKFEREQKERDKLEQDLIELNTSQLVTDIDQNAAAQPSKPNLDDSSSSSSDSEDQNSVPIDPDKTITYRCRLAFEYESGLERIELPEYASLKELEEKAKPIKKTKPQRNIQNLQITQSQAAEVIKHNISK